MSDEASITGAAINGEVGTAVFTFYAGPVGIRARDGIREVAFFSMPVAADLPCEGFLGDEAVMVTALRMRDLNPGERTRARDVTLRAIIATVIPSPAT